MNQNLELPESWKRVKLIDISQIFMGQSPKASEINSEGKGLPFFQGKTEFTDVYPIINKHCEQPSRIAEQNDILLSVRAPVGPVNLASEKKVASVVAFVLSELFLEYHLNICFTS